MLTHSELVYVKKVKGKGRGVFARRSIAAGTIIENVPKMLLPIEWIAGGFANPNLCAFFLHDKRTIAICLGYGSLYNHSFRPNAEYEDGPVATMIFRAIRAIKPDEEICVNYNGDPKDKSPVGFEVME